MDNGYHKRRGEFFRYELKPAEKAYQLPLLLRACIKQHLPGADRVNLELAAETILAALAFQGWELKKRPEGREPFRGETGGSDADPIGSEVRVIPGDRRPGESERDAELRHRYAPPGWDPPERRMRLKRPTR